MYVMGATVSELGRTSQEALGKIRGQVCSAGPMTPDSDIVVFNPFTKEVHRYRVKKSVDWVEVWKGYEELDLEEVAKDSKIDSGTGCATSVASIFGPQPTKDEPWVGYVHLH
jgi:hypothetical protein